MTQHLKPRSVTIPLYQGDDMDRLAELQRAVKIAERIAENGQGAARFGDDDQSLSDAKAAFDAFVDEAAERAVTVELRSIGRRRFRDLLLEHPPRMVVKNVAPPVPGETVVVPDAPEMVEHADDAGYGVNTTTFPEALLCYFDDSEDEPVQTIAQPEFATTAARRRFVNDELAEGDFERLWIDALMLNRSPSRDPKALRYMSASPNSDET